MNPAIERCNHILMQKLSLFLNLEPDFITPGILDELCADCALTPEEAYSFVLASAIGLDVEKDAEDRALFLRYFPEMVHLLTPAEFASDPYLRTVTLPACAEGSWTLGYAEYRPCEAFVCGDLLACPDGAVIPQLGFFRESFRYPVVKEDGREWMTVTPNEIRTMAPPLSRARGRVLTYGLGLGYFAFMAARKEIVTDVTVIERDVRAIRLFERYIRPQLPCAGKISVICGDAFAYAERNLRGSGYDFIFADIWHDPADGVPAYRRLKASESALPSAEFAYWIEPTLRWYL